jgi:hypothetical protein
MEISPERDTHSSTESMKMLPIGKSRANLLRNQQLVKNTQPQPRCIAYPKIASLSPRQGTHDHINGLT